MVLTLWQKWLNHTQHIYLSVKKSDNQHHKYWQRKKLKEKYLMDTFVVFAFNELNASRRCKIKRYSRLFKCPWQFTFTVLFMFSPDIFVCLCSVCILSVGATVALFEAAGATAATVCVWDRETTEVKGEGGESGSQTQEDPCHEGPSGLQQSHQWQPVYVQYLLNHWLQQSSEYKHC